MKAINKIVIVTLVLMAFACGKESQPVTEIAFVPVEIGNAITRTQEGRISASGRIEAKNSANVSTRFMGHITRVNVKVGDRVTQGQHLVSISNSDLLAKQSQVEAAISQAESALVNAAKDFERFQTLFKKESASEKELDDMTTRFEIAKANLESAQQMRNEVRAQLAYTDIVAPFDGNVINTFVKAGDMANPGMPLVSVEGGGKLQATSLVSESDISKIRTDTETKVLVKALDKEFKGKIIEMSSSAKNTGGQYAVKIDLDDVSEDVLPGMFVNVMFSTETNSDSKPLILVESKSLVKNGQLTGIYALGNEDTAILRWLRIGKTYGDYTEVLSGISENESYIVTSEGKLYNGVNVSHEPKLTTR